MTWSDDTQRRTKDAMSHIEYGTLTLGDDGTVECTTYLSEIRMAQATRKAAQSGYPLAASAIMCDGTITNGAVTFTDTAGAVNAGATIYYELRGLWG
jgi:hypothetical protein